MGDEFGAMCMYAPGLNNSTTEDFMRPVAYIQITHVVGSGSSWRKKGVVAGQILRWYCHFRTKTSWKRKIITSGRSSVVLCIYYPPYKTDKSTCKSTSPETANNYPNQINSVCIGSAAHALLVKETGPKEWIPKFTFRPKAAGTRPTPNAAPITRLTILHIRIIGFVRRVMGA